MNHEELQDLCAAYALGCADDADRARLEALLASGSLEAEAALREFSHAVIVLATTAPAVAPPPSLRDRVLDHARADVGGASIAAPIVPLAPRRTNVIAIAGWLAAAACLAFALVNWNAVARLRRTMAERDTRIAALEQERAQLEERLAGERRWAGVATASDARVAVLAPTPDGDPALRGRAVVDPATRRAVVVFTHSTPPAGRDYELWMIRDGKPRSLGVVRADEHGDAVVRLENVGDATTLAAFAVSLEPAGGAPTDDAPTGPVVAVGALGS
jgi:anti-sigma-K factor RskA